MNGMHIKRIYWNYYNKNVDAYKEYTADVRRHTGWIRDNNRASKAISNYFGFKADGFRQEVFVYNI